MRKSLSIFLVGCLLTACSLSLQPYPELQPISFKADTPDPFMRVVLSEADDAYLTQLREEFPVDELKRDHDLDTLLAVTDWVHHLWTHDGSNIPENQDPVSILRDVHAGMRFRCVEYSIVIAGCLNALGLPARVLSLRTQDMETRESGAGHVVCEAYLAEYDRWVLVDGQWNVVTFYNDEPLNAVQLQTMLLEDPGAVKLLTLHTHSKERFKRWIAPYLYFFQYRLDQRYVPERYTDWLLMLVPVGETHPEVFQIEYPIEKVHFTHNLNDFYQPPRFTPPENN